MEPLISSKSDYLFQPALGDLHQISVKWLSEMKFWDIELDFFKNLLDKYFLSIATSREMDNLEQLQKKIIHTKVEVLDRIFQEVMDHEKKLSELVENEFSHDEQEYRDVHKDYEEQIISFKKEFQLLKKEVFGFVEGIIKQKKK